MGPGEWVKLRLSQTLIRDARPDSINNVRYVWEFINMYLQNIN
jgi:hypothetical protein